jgi:hypothetical protein
MLSQFVTHCIASLNPLSGSCRYAGVGVAKLGTHRAVISALALLTLVRVDGKNLFNVADGLVWALSLASAAAVAQFGNDFVSHDALLLENSGTFVCVQDFRGLKNV